MGTHHLLNLYGVQPLLLTDLDSFVEFMRPTLQDNMAHVVGEVHHSFPGEQSGYTALFLLSSSHFSIHTWPEKNEAAVDLFTCGEIVTDAITRYVTKYFSPLEYNLRVISR
jgi:S-adenosylmethionine decarboxylase